MKPIQMNEELLADSGFFADADQRAELSRIFKFDSRRVILGEGAAYLLARECRRLQARRLLLLRDGAVEHLEEPVRWILDREGIELAGVFDRVVPNPTVDSVDDFAETLRNTDCDAVSGAGGRQLPRYRQGRPPAPPPAAAPAPTTSASTCFPSRRAGR